MARAMSAALIVRAPATSANLGPGFDILGAALGLQLELEVREADAFAIDTDLPVPRDRDNLLVRAFERLAPADRLSFRISSRIPLAAGLGSSAAAIVAGLLAGAAVRDGGLRGAAPRSAADEVAKTIPGGPETDELLALATELEGHPDNVAAALHGGFVLCADGTATRLDPPAGLDGLLVLPRATAGMAAKVSTVAARDALPAEVPLADAVFNAAHVGLLVLGLAQGRLELVARALADRLHQPRRRHLYPRSLELVERAAELGALGATISGAGPAVLVWTTSADGAAVAERLRAEVGGWGEILPASFSARGASVERR